MTPPTVSTGRCCDKSAIAARALCRTFEPIDLFTIITDAASGRMGLPVEAHQMKALFS